MFHLSLFMASAAILDKASASELTRPTEVEAADAITELVGLADMRKDVSVKLGTCIPAVDAEHSAQIACTVAVKLGAGTTETQADFYLDGTAWVAQPSVSQDKLPFPDPAL
jgi:hypothetical protein